MPGEVFDVHLRDKDFLEADSSGVTYHWEPGYYFRDEEGDLYGPFLNEEQGNVALQLYLKQLERGESPTQQSIDPNVPYIPGEDAGEYARRKRKN